MKGYKLPVGKLYFTDTVFDTLVLEDVYAAIDRHVTEMKLDELRTQPRPEGRFPPMSGPHLISVHEDRQGTKFAIATQVDLARTTVVPFQEHR